MTMLYCRRCGQRFPDADRGEPIDNLIDHIVDDHQNAYRELLEDVFIGRPGDEDQTIIGQEAEP